MAREIEMLCWFDKLGNPNPVRFQVADHEGLNQVIRIDRVKRRQLERQAGNRMIVFICEATINGVNREICLKYEVDTCRWIIF